MTKQQEDEFKDTLQAHLRHPYPGCIFVGATTSSHQHEALQVVRDVCSNKQAEAQVAELHPTLLGGKVNEVRQDIQQAFQHQHQEQHGDVGSSSSIASSISIYPTDRDVTMQKILIVPSAHLLRSSHPASTWTQFLHPPREYTVIMISSLPLERWKTAEGVEVISGTRPVIFMNFSGHSRADIEQVLRTTLEEEEQADSISLSKFKSSTFVAFVAAALTSEVGHGNLRELQFLTLAIWSAFTAITAGRETVNYQESLSTILRPLVRSALSQLHTRRIGVDAWIEQVQKESISSQSQPSQLSSQSTLLLLSSFLCSHLPAKYDTRYFLRDEAALPNYNTTGKSKRRKRRQSVTNNQQDDTSQSSSILLGPKPFTYQRMMYVYQNLSVEFEQKYSQEDIYSTRTISNLQQLIQHQYIVITSPPTTSEGQPAIPTRLEHLNQMSLRSNISKHHLQEIVCRRSSTGDEESDRERLSWWNRVVECGL
ncbi:unnamed protein product [Sympodiomycopsis kandeliae]